MMTNIEVKSLEFRSNAEEFWRDWLRGLTAPLKLPAIAPSSTSHPSRGTQAIRLSPAKTSDLTTFAKNYKLTLYTVIQGAWSLLLSRYCRETDVLFGATRGGGSHVEGLFCNPLPVRVSVNPYASVLSWLRELEAKWVGVEEYASIPLAQIRNWSEVPPELPLFETLLVFGKGGIEAGDYSLVLSVDTESDWLLNIDYERSQFGDDAIARMLGHLETLLTGIIAAPEQCLGQIPLLTEKERHQLLVEWNQTETDYPKNKCIQQLFEEQVKRTPDAVALVFEEKQLTYRELNFRANQLAHYLQKLGVKPEVLVGICAERSVEMVIGLLGILKAGGAYVPLDPTYPSDRLAFMLEDANVSVLLTQHALIEKLPHHQATTICLDTDWKTIERESQDNPSSQGEPNNLAYIIYTSGSTGKPKGVTVTHRGVNRLICNTNYIKLESSDKIAQVSNISFDAATFEIWGALLNGAQLVGMSRDIILSPEEFSLQLHQLGITVLFLTTALFQQIAKVTPNAFACLRTLLFGGETVDPRWVKKILKNGAPQQLLHVYGPTENTTFSSYYCVEVVAESATTIPIGRPISNTQIYLLDEQLQPVPVGVVGELYIGGYGLARGYLNRPELTLEKFISNPFSNSNSSFINSLPITKLYRTGDLACYRSDGNIEFLGRIDNQVKIRGFRIELEEIEAALNQHPAIQETLVIPREDSPDNKRLVAYIILKSDSQQEIGNQRVFPNQLHRFLKQKLPDYMVPSAFVVLESFPLTPNGKIDRRALPAPDLSRLREEETFVAPRTPTEEILAAFWQEVLKVNPIGIHDNFFELGGHSLLGTQVVSRISRAFGIHLSIRTLFEAPTIAELCDRIDAILHPQSGEDSSTAVNPDTLEPIQPISRKQDLPLSFAQESLWFLDQLEGKNAAYNISMAFKLKGNLNLPALEKALTLLTERHEILRTNTATCNGVPVAILHDNYNFGLSLINLKNLAKATQEAEVTQFIQKEALEPFDLENDSLIRGSLLQLQAQEHILLLTLHHIISDGWSTNLLHRELGILYSACLQKTSSPLPPLPIQYIDFANWQRKRFAGETLQKQLSYWKQQLADAPPLLNLPTDYPRPTIQTFSGAKHSHPLPATLSEALKTLSQREGTTLFMTLLAAFKVLLSRYTGTEDIVVGSPVAGRTRPELEPLIGFFINTVVLRTRWDNNPSFQELLAKVKEVTLGAYEHQEMPFDKLVEELHPERNLSYNPLFQVWFNLLNLEGQGLEMPGLTVETLSSTEATAKFDITLYVSNKPEGIELEWVYNRGLFNLETIVMMAERFQTLLENILNNPAQPISNLSVLSDKERQRLRHAKNSIVPHHSFIEFSKAAIEQSISARFEEQVRNYPDNIAISTKKYQWTYRELNYRANAIARNLLQLYPDGAQRIALLFEHDASMIAAILGVLKAGKTYVPLDPTYPQLRLSYILEDSQTTVLLTNRQNLDFAQKITNKTIKIINVDEIKLEAYSDEFHLLIAPATLAYILYTSGSTGQPKGVLQNHRNVLHFIRNYTNNLHIAANDKLTLLASYSFDAAVMDIFGALLNGATLYPIDIKTDGLTHFANTLKQAEITIYHSTPTVYRHFLDTLPQPSADSETPFPQIRLVVMGGEEVIKKDVDLYHAYFSQKCIFVNGLGPTESTVTLQYFIDQETKQVGNLVPVGYAVEETEVLLLNPAGSNAEIYGEIAIKSPYIALGYWQKPELTQAAFLPAPDVENCRIYRTGDLGRLRIDGTIEFLGRKDFQVKIRGFRIELSEIEATLNQHQAVKETVVLAQEDERGNKRLVAYIVPVALSPHHSLSPSLLRTFLKEKLPDYMVPSDFVLLDGLPLTPSGKINRRALPLVTPNFAEIKSEQHPTPVDPLELQLVKIWENILGVHPIGLNDNFFDLGGHSLLAVRLFSEIEKIFGKPITLTTLFQYPTIAELANILRQEGLSTSWSSLVPIHPQGSKPPLFYIHTVYGGLIHSRNLLLKMGTDQPVYGLQARGFDGKEAPHTCIEEMASHYIKEIQTVQPHGPYLLAGWCVGGMIAFEMAQQLHAQGEKVQLLAILEAYPPRIISQFRKIPERSYLDKVEVVFDRLRLHLKDMIQRNRQQLNALSLPEKMILIGESLNRRTQNKINQVVYKFYRQRNFQVPPELRYLFITEAISQAYKNYYPQAYTGKIIFFRAVEQPKGYADYLKVWEELAAGGLEIHEVPGHHDSIISEPHVGVLAEKLKACIARVLGS